MKDVANSTTAIGTEVVSVTKNNLNTVSTFLSLGRDYLKDLPHGEREKFLQSTLARQAEPDRWLLLLKHQNEYVGFVHMKIDKDERLGWGFILEFYIVPNKRKMGLGRTLFGFCANILQSQNVKNVWLLTNLSAEPFWRSLGFKQTGEKDRESGRDVWAKAL